MSDLGDKISHLERVKAILYKHFAHEIDVVIQKAIQNAAAELLNIIPQKYLRQVEKSATPRGVKISFDSINNGQEYMFVLTDWIAKKKELPKQFSTKVEEITEKAIRITYNEKTIWLPKSQIEVYKEVEQ